jgi:hypothetical protein
MGHFAATILELNADLVAFFEKLFGVPQLRFVIVPVDVDPKLDFLQPAGRATLVLVVLGSFVFELAVIDDAANGGIGSWGDLDKIEAKILRVAQGVGEFHDAQLFAVGGQDDPHFAGANPAVDSDLLELDGLLLGWAQLRGAAE